MKQATCHRAVSRRGLRGVLLAVLGLAVLYAVVPRPPVREGLGFSQAVFDREGRLLRLTLSPDEKYRLWVPLERVDAEAQVEVEIGIGVRGRAGAVHAIDQAA